MEKTTEQRTVLTMGGRITRVNIIEEGKSIEVFSISDCADHPETVKGTAEYIEKYFPIVKASTLSLEDEFLKHKVKSNEQKRIKKQLIKAIKSGLSDFRVQRMDPSFDCEGNICFCAGMHPAVGKSADWWEKAAKEFMPEKESRLGTSKERIAFLGLLIKYLIQEEGYTVSAAWDMVCDQSKKLGHYHDSKNAKLYFEPTGSRQVGEWYDLANTSKVILNNKGDDFWFVSGHYDFEGYVCPLSHFGKFLFPFGGNLVSVGWIILSV